MAFAPQYIFIIFTLILIDYYCGKWIEKSYGKERKILLIISIFSTCAVLFFFKYFNFFNANLTYITEKLHIKYPIANLSILLPIGLSFHTFQSLSYVIEVYRGNQKAERNLDIYALYVMFYPQLVAGPIERPQNLLHQFYERHYFEYQRVSDGLKLMAWGIFKKIVIADRLAIFVNQAYNNPTSYTGIPWVVATVFFAYQIYCDFSGYSDIAIGAAQVMGFKLMDNFNRPYFSRSVSEFWKRWHISLSSWFKDYIYIPLGGNRVPINRKFYNLLITFLISGLWHGANWTFVLWGFLNWSYIFFGKKTRSIRKNFNLLIGLSHFPKIHKCIQITATFILICFGWVFFRSDTVKSAFYILKNIFASMSFIPQAIMEKLAGKQNILAPLFIDQTKNEFILSITLICFLEFIHFIQRHGSIRHMLRTKPTWFRWAIYYTFVISILCFGKHGTIKFIYFQF